LSAWSKAEHLARRIYQLTTVPTRSENHPTWEPAWRTAIEQGFLAICAGDEAKMKDALREIDRLALTLSFSLKSARTRAAVRSEIPVGWESSNGSSHPLLLALHLPDGRTLFSTNPN
jgi:hypothetical protein